MISPLDVVTTPGDNQAVVLKKVDSTFGVSYLAIGSLVRHQGRGGGTPAAEDPYPLTKRRAGEVDATSGWLMDFTDVKRARPGSVDLGSVGGAVAAVCVGRAGDVHIRLRVPRSGGSGEVTVCRAASRILFR